MSDLRFDGRVAIITGAGNGLGRAHALLLASRGCKVVVNDLGGAATGGGKSSAAADKVVEEIKAAGGEAVANYDSVEDGDKVVQTALDTWKRIDILVNNAGILRDTSFVKMTDEDWDLIIRVHVRGAYKTTKAAWDHMRNANYGRVIFTASAAGIYGNFGQTNYAAAKMGVIGLSNTLALEGKKYGIQVNTIAPIAASRLTETVAGMKDLLPKLNPEYVSPLVAWLTNEACQDTGGLFEVGGGVFTKLRWERTKGKALKLGRTIQPEQVQKAWADVTNFANADHPTDIMSSMQPVLSNLDTKALGGNEFIDVDAGLGYEFPPVKTRYDERDLALYALGVGAAKNPLSDDLQFVYEMGAGFQAIPTFAVVPALNMVFEAAKKGEQAPGMNYGFERILHGEQYTELFYPLAPNATLTHKAKIKDIFDKGKNALVVMEINTYDEDGNKVFKNEVTTFVRGAGGWGGDRGPSADINVPPQRPADVTAEDKLDENQALLYRLSGDINPLHADPEFAQNFGFKKPILHGLCTYGFAARNVIKAFAKNDGRLFKSIKARFSASVFPGETLVTEMWKESDERIVFRVLVKERGEVVISNAAIELYKEIPKKPAKAVAAAPPASASGGAAASGPSGPPTSGEAFAVIADYIGKNAGLAKDVGKTFLFKLSGPDSAWTIDLKAGAGSVASGGTTADCTLEMSDADFCDMVAGKADAMKLYMGKKLKIGGDIMASQKLMFLKNIDPAAAAGVVAKLRGAGGGASAGGGGAAAPSGEPTSGEAFAVIADYIGKNGGLAKDVGKTFLFKLSEPDSAWTIDLKTGAGSVTSGGTTADCTLEMSDADFRDMVAGKADAMKLYMGKKLKIGGDIMASQKLMFLKSIDPKAAADVVAKLRGASGGGGGAAAGGAAKAAPTAPAAPKEPKAPGILKALAERLSKDKALAAEVNAVIALKVSDLGKAWTLDFKSGSIKEGADASATTTVSLDDASLVALTKGETVQSLYQHGSLRVDGDLRPAHKLTILKGL